MTKSERKKVIGKLLKMVWDSLSSHIPYMYSKSPEGEEFHKRCCKEYAEMIQLLAKLL